MGKASGVRSAMGQPHPGCSLYESHKINYEGWYCVDGESGSNLLQAMEESAAFLASTRSDEKRS